MLEGTATITAIALVIVVGIVSAVTLACTMATADGTTPTTTTRPATTTTTTTRPGNPDVYAEIDATTNCADLQAMFDTAATNHQRQLDAGNLDQAKIPTAYMQHINERMTALGCYD